MVIPIYLPLLPIINTPNGIIILLLIVLIVTIVSLFISRFRMEGASVIRIQRPPIAAQSMSLIKNSFTFSINDESLKSANLTDGVKCLISCDSSYWIVHYWGVEINELHNSISVDYQLMKEKILSGSFLQDNDPVVTRSEPDLFFESNEKKTHLIKPNLNEDDLTEKMGNFPRSKYPLVVIVIRNDDDDGEGLKSNDVVCLVAIIHIRDRVCPMDSKLLYQLVKQRNGRIYDLKDLYVVSDSPTPDESSSSSQSSSTNLCVICCSAIISRALLPCRHACVCGDCFVRIDKCPLCRCSIISFFKLIDDPETNEQNEENNSNNNQNQQHPKGWFSSFNKKINNLLGLN